MARETHEATERVTEAVVAVPSGTTHPVDPLERISAVITRIGSLQPTIAAAVDERTGAREVGRSAEHVALVTADRSSVVGRSGDDGTQATAQGGSADHATADLVRMAGNVRVLVGQFQS